MSHGGCCNCLLCKLGKSLGLMEECKKGDACCQAAPKKSVKKPVKKATKKVVTKSKTKAKKK